jgi:hypothetical protein
VNLTSDPEETAFLSSDVREDEGVTALPVLDCSSLVDLIQGSCPIGNARLRLEEIEIPNFAFEFQQTNRV